MKEDFIGAPSYRIGNNVHMLLKEMECFDNSFEINDCVYNVIAKVVLPQEAVFSLLNHKC